MCEMYDSLDAWPAGSYVHFSVRVKFDNCLPFYIVNFKVPMSDRLEDVQAEAESIKSAALNQWFSKHFPAGALRPKIEAVVLTGGTVTLPYKHKRK